MRPPRQTLEKLYLVDRLTTRQIGAQFGISKTEVIRCLRRYGIRARAPHCGLANREITAPTRDELISMVREQHMGYREIAERYGVDSTAVPYWLKKHGIRRPTVWETRRKGRIVVMPTPDELRALYESGLSLEHVAWMHGVSATPMYALAHRCGITVRPSGWKQGKRWVCEDGHISRSSFEMRVDNWLHAHGVCHRTEPRIPYTCQRRADFWADGWYIEIWGVVNRPSYKARQAEKREHYQRHAIPLIELSVHDFSSQSPIWQQKLTDHLDVEPLLVPA